MGMSAMDDGQVRALAGGMHAEIKETHISWVLLADYAYKIKKPVKFSFLDFSTLEKREFFCNEELRLNRRLAPETYLGVVRICRKNDGFAFVEGSAGEAPVLDYAVKMKRLNQEHMMSLLLAKGKICAGHLKKLASIIADFHGRAESVQGYNTPEMIGAQIADLGNFRASIEEACGMGKQVDEVLAKSAGFIGRNRTLLLERIREGRVKDCHGDLHSGNIFVNGAEITVIDCIEFSRDFRCVDVASEIAFMAMDLDAHGRADLSAAFVQEYVALTGDHGLIRLLDFYRCYRANVRAKVAAIDWLHGKDEKERIKKYLTLADKYASSL
jgi:hypothetical protein